MPCLTPHTLHPSEPTPSPASDSKQCSLLLSARVARIRSCRICTCISTPTNLHLLLRTKRVQVSHEHHVLTVQHDTLVLIQPLKHQLQLPHGGGGSQLIALPVDVLQQSRPLPSAAQTVVVSRQLSEHRGAHIVTRTVTGESEHRFGRNVPGTAGSRSAQRGRRD